MRPCCIGLVILSNGEPGSFHIEGKVTKHWTGTDIYGPRVKGSRKFHAWREADQYLVPLSSQFSLFYSDLMAQNYKYHSQRTV
jgi:hypothetical protein